MLPELMPADKPPPEGLLSVLSSFKSQPMKVKQLIGLR
jgi:hypothetical protein